MTTETQEDFFKDAPEHMEIEELEIRIKKILQIDQRNLDTESLRQSDIFFEMQQLYIRESSFLRWLSNAHAKVKLYRHQYYLGQLPSAVYAKERLNVKPLKGELPMYMAADPIMNEIDGHMAEANERVAFLEDSMKHIRDRGFNIKTACEFRAFMMGS